MQKYVFPFRASLAYAILFRAEKYARRIDPHDAMALHIYRNKWEMILPETRPLRCVQRLEDFPDMVDLLAKLNNQDQGQQQLL